MKKLILLAIAILMGTGSLLAQKRGEVEEVKDPKIDALIAKRTSLYQQPHDVAGYRIELYNGEERETYIEMRNKYRTLYPGGETHLKYIDSKFSLRVGNCRTREEASRLKTELSSNFAGARIIEDMIRVSADD